MLSNKEEEDHSMFRYNSCMHTQVDMTYTLLFQTKNDKGLQTQCFLVSIFRH